VSHPTATAAATGAAQHPAGAVPAPGALAPAVPGPAPTPAPASTTPARPPLSTPQRLQLLSSGVVVLGVLLALVGVATFVLLAVGLDRARADTEQLVRVQSIQTDLLRADATATNAFLVGGLEPAAQRAAYDQAMSSSSARIAEAAQAQPADAAALAVLNQQILDYDAGIEQARANNRQGLPIGAQYLRSASAQLRADALPIADNLVSANAERARDRMEIWIGLAFVLVAVLAPAFFVVGQVWLARRFRRTFNRGMLAGSVLLLVLLVGGIVLLLNLNGAVRAIQDGSFAAVNRAAGARIEASNAKSNESLTLIARGSGGAFETAWKNSTASVTGDLAGLGSEAPTAEWNSYLQVHQEIRALDDGGQWDQAVALATGTGKESANTVFNAFDARLADTLERSAAEAGDGLSGWRPGLIAAAILALLGGIGVALLARSGVATRLREYR
jgi:hypothetical protein